MHGLRKTQMPQFKIDKYSYKNEIYEIIDASLLMKHPDTGKWLPALSYHNVKSTKIRYTRLLSDFKRKFKLIEDKKELPNEAI